MVRLEPYRRYAELAAEARTDVPGVSQAERVMLSFSVGRLTCALVHSGRCEDDDLARHLLEAEYLQHHAIDGMGELLSQATQIVGDSLKGDMPPAPKSRYHYDAYLEMLKQIAVPPYRCKDRILSAFLMYGGSSWLAAQDG